MEVGDSKGSGGARAFQEEIIVPFADTDQAGIVHFANFFRYMENTEHAFLRSLGLSVHPKDWAAEDAVGWPRVKAECTYHRPILFEDRLVIKLDVAQVRTKSVRYAFAFYRADEEALIAEGEVVVVCVRKTSEGMKSVRIPDTVREALLSRNY